MRNWVIHTPKTKLVLLKAYVMMYGLISLFFKTATTEFISPTFRLPFDGFLSLSKKRFITQLTSRMIPKAM